MAVSTTNAVSGPYVANGSTTSFPFTFKALAADELRVTITVADAEAEVAPTEFVATINEGASGGDVVFTTAPASGDVRIYSAPAFTQEASFASGQRFSPTAVNDALDRSVVRDQYLLRKVDALLDAQDAGIVGDVRSDLASSAPDKGSTLIGFLQAGTGAAARTVQDKLRDTISVRDFGAVGNGATDDTSAIQAAVNAAAGKELWFPPGRYKITSAINILAGLSIVGSRNRSTIMLGTQNQNGFVIGDGTELTRGATGATSIKYLDFNPAAGVSTSTSGACIKVNYAYNALIDWCTFYGKDSGGTIRLFNAVEASRGEECYELNCEAYYMGGSLYAGTGTGLGADRNIDWRVDNCKAIGVVGTNVYFGAFSEGCTVNTLIAYGFPGKAIHINTSLFNFFISQPNIEVGTGATGVHVQAGSTVQIESGWFGGETGLSVDATASGVTADAVRFDQSKIVINGAACAVSDCQITGASAGVGIAVAATAVDFSAVGNRIRQWASGITFSGNPPRFNITGNNFKNNTTDVAGSAWAASTADPGVISGNTTDALVSVTYASALALQVTRTTYQISGAGAVTSATVFPHGSRLLLQASGSGNTINHGTSPGQFVTLTGSNLALAANKFAEFISDGVEWVQI